MNCLKELGDCTLCVFRIYVPICGLQLYDYSIQLHPVHGSLTRDESTQTQLMRISMFHRAYFNSIIYEYQHMHFFHIQHCISLEC